MVKESNVTLSLSNGMKQTEIGLLPEDWEVVNLNEVSKISSSKRIFESDYVAYGIPFYRGKEISLLMQNKTIDEPFYISEAKYFSLANKYGYPKNGDLLITAVGTLGNIYCINNDEKFYFKDGNLIWINNIIQNPKFLKIALDYNKQQILDNAIGSSQKALTINSLSITKIPLPPLPEQEAIAEALSDADAWIESLEQLIAKKRLIKQGAMQELLSPKQNWEEKTIFEVADKKRDLFNDGDWIEAVHIKEEGIRLIQTGNIGVGRFLNKNNKKYISEKSFVELKCKEIIEGDLLICRLAEPAGRVCIFPKTEDLKSVTSVDVTIYRPDENIFDRRILLYLLSTDEWFKQVLEQVGGTTHKRISRGNLGNIKIKIPKSLTEQTRIATILSDMDAELEALEGQLSKARKVKQGMMQELLSGRVRLV